MISEVIKVILDGVFQKFITADETIFNVSNKIISIAWIDAFIVIWEIFFNLTWRVRSLLGYLFVKLQVFAISRTENYYKGTPAYIALKIRMLKWSYFSQFLRVVAFENTQAKKKKKTCSKLKTKMHWSKGNLTHLKENTLNFSISQCSGKCSFPLFFLIWRFFGFFS